MIFAIVWSTLDIGSPQYRYWPTGHTEVVHEVQTGSAVAPASHSCLYWPVRHEDVVHVRQREGLPATASALYVPDGQASQVQPD